MIDWTNISIIVGITSVVLGGLYKFLDFYLKKAMSKQTTFKMFQEELKTQIDVYKDRVNELESRLIALEATLTECVKSNAVNEKKILELELENMKLKFNADNNGM